MYARKCGILWAGKAGETGILTGPFVPQIKEISSILSVRQFFSPGLEILVYKISRFAQMFSCSVVVFFPQVPH